MHFQQRTLAELFDPSLMLANYYHKVSIENELLRVLHVGLSCTQETTSLMLPSMSKALRMLVGNEPTSPPFMDEITMEINDIDRTSIMAMQLQLPPFLTVFSTPGDAKAGYFLGLTHHLFNQKFI